MRKLIRFEENMPAIEAIILKNAPHGSGINGKYENIHAEHYSGNNENRIIFDNVFDHMDENGFYDGYLKFRVTIGADLAPKIIFKGLTRQERWILEKEDYFLRDYLEQVYAYWIDTDSELLELLAKVF